MKRLQIVQHRESAAGTTNIMAGIQDHNSNQDVADDSCIGTGNSSVDTAVTESSINVDQHVTPEGSHGRGVCHKGVVGRCR